MCHGGHHAGEQAALEKLFTVFHFIHVKKIIYFIGCKDCANERNASLLADYKVSAAYLRKICCKDSASHPNDTG